MGRLRIVLVLAMALVAMFVTSSAAFAGLEWCDVGSPPPMDTGIAPNPDKNPNGMPTPMFQNKNGKFDANPLAGTEGGPPAGALVPPGMAKAAK